MNKYYNILSYYHITTLPYYNILQNIIININIFYTLYNNKQMVLGFLLYEAVDVAYHATKLTFNGVAFVYNWYYGISINNLDNKVRHDEEHIKMLEDRVKQLENLLDVSGNTVDKEVAEDNNNIEEYCDSI